MTVVNRKTEAIIKGSGYRFVFSINVLRPEDIKVYIDDKLLVNIVDYSIKVNALKATEGYTVYTSVELTLVKPVSNQVVKVTSDSAINQTIEYSNQVYINPSQLEGSLDKLTVISQQLRDAFTDFEGSFGAFKDLDFDLINPNTLMVTDGNGKVKFTLALTPPTQSDIGKVLALDPSLNKIVYKNPFEGSASVPDPSGLPYPKLLIGEADGYQFWVGVELPAATDTGKVLVYTTLSDGSIGITGETAPGLFNAPIPTPNPYPIEYGLFSYNGEYKLRDKTYAEVLQSSGIYLGFRVSKLSDTSIRIESGFTVSYGYDPVVPDAVGYTRLLAVPGQETFTIDPTTTSSKVLFLHVTITAPSSAVYTIESSNVQTALGDKLCLASIVCTKIEGGASVITTIKPEFTLVGNVANQMQQLSRIDGGRLSSNCAIQGNGARQVDLIGGEFSGYGVNSFEDIQNAHIRQVSSQSQIPIIFCYPDGKQLPAQTLISSADIAYISSSGSLTPLASTQVTYYPVWLYPDGRVVLQLHSSVWDIVNEPTIDVVLRTVTDPLIFLKQASKIALLRCTSTGTFTSVDTDVKWVIIGLNGDVVASGAGNSIDGLPATQLSDNRKFLIQFNNQWLTSTYAMPLSITTAKKYLRVNSSATGLEESDADPIDQDSVFSTALLNNGILNGFETTINTDQLSITIEQGVSIFMGNSDGLSQVTKVNYSGTPSLTIPNLGDQQFTFVTFVSDGTFEFTTNEPEYVRGNKLILYRIEHEVGTRLIQDVLYRFTPLNAVNKKIRNLYDQIGTKTESITPASEGTNQIKYSAGIFRGYNVNKLDALDSDKVTIPSKNPATFEFRTSANIDSGVVSTFPDTPKYESASGTLTDIPNGNSAYFPVWLYPSGKLIIQYPVEIYTTTIPTVTDWLFSLIRNSDANKYGCLIGAILWTVGSDFSGVCKVINISGASISEGATSTQTLPPSVENDAGKVYQVGTGGDPTLGLRIPYNSTGSNISRAKSLLQYNLDGTELVTITPSDLQFTFLSGTTDTHVVTSQDGKLRPLRNGDKHPFPTVWNINDLMFSAVESPAIRLVRVAIELKLFLVNNFTSRPSRLYGGDWIEGVDTFTLDYKQTSPYNILLPSGFIGSDANRNLFTETKSKTTPLTNRLLTNYPSASLIDKSASTKLVSALPEIDVYDRTPSFDFYSNLVNSLHGDNVGCFGGVYIDTTKLKSIAPNYRLNLRITYFGQTNQLTSYMYSSSSVPTSPVNATQTTSYDTFIDGSVPNIYHSNTLPPVADSRVGLSFVTIPNQTKVDYTTVKHLIEMTANIPAGTNIADKYKTTRLQYKPLAALNALTASDGITLGDSIPDLKRGDILCVYYLGAIGNFLITSKNSYKPELRGIALTPTRQSIDNYFPDITLEKPNGAAYPVDIASFQFLGCNNPMYAVYKIANITQDMFDNYNVCIYLRNTSSDILTKCTALEAQVGFVNV